MRVLNFKIYFSFILFLACTLNSYPKNTIVNIGNYNLLVDVALTEKQKKNGLMFKKKLVDTNGMLFIYKKPKKVKFWMKNTHISLAIIFIDNNKKIKKIIKGKTLSDEVITSDHPIIAVLEIPFSCLKTLNLKINDNVFWNEPSTKKINNRNIYKNNLFPCL